MPEPLPYWRTKSLEELTKSEWEQLCDGCGRCCLIKLEDEDTGTIHHTDIGCTLFNSATCRCKDYKNRAKKVPDCVTLTPEQVRTLPWLPPTCAYWLVAEGRDLYDWHPLKSGDPASVHRAGVSVQGRVHCSEDELPLTRWPDRVRQWPNRVPRVKKA
ncbi:MAG: YcgN family cysteine cluster protein [Beijerinckiaceae bacterium]